MAWSLVIAAAVADGLGAAACLGFGAGGVDGGARYRPFSMFGKKAGTKHTSNVSSFAMKVSNMWANRISMNIQENVNTETEHDQTEPTAPKTQYPGSGLMRFCAWPGWPQALPRRRQGLSVYLT